MKKTDKIKVNINIDDLNCILNRLENLELQYKHQKDNIKQIIYNMNRNNDDLLILKAEYASAVKAERLCKKKRDKLISLLENYNIYNHEYLEKYLDLHKKFGFNKCEK